MFDQIGETITTWWRTAWSWCYNSGSIALAYVIAAFGAAVTFVGGMDWAPLWSFLGTGTEFTRQQLIGIGISVLGAGVTAYKVRTSGTKEVEGHLLPTKEALPANMTATIKTKTKKSKKTV